MTHLEQGYWQQVKAAAQAANHPQPDVAADKALAEYRIWFQESKVWKDIRTSGVQDLDV